MVATKMNYLDRVCASSGYEDEFDDIGLIEARLKLLNNLTPKQQRERYNRALMFRLDEIMVELESQSHPCKSWNQIQLIKYYKELTGDLV